MGILRPPRSAKACSNSAAVCPTAPAPPQPVFSPGLEDGKTNCPSGRGPEDTQSVRRLTECVDLPKTNSAKVGGHFLTTAKHSLGVRRTENATGWQPHFDRR